MELVVCSCTCTCVVARARSCLHVRGGRWLFHVRGCYVSLVVWLSCVVVACAHGCRCLHVCGCTCT